MVIPYSKKSGDLLLLANGLVFFILLNLVTSNLFFRWDLTEENRYTLNQPTKDLLKDLDDVVYIEVYLDGDLNAGFTRLQKSIRETLEEFRIYSGNKVKFRFVDPSTATDQRARNEFMRSIVEKGITPMNIIDTKDGQRSEKVVFPGALISYGGFETGVMLLKGNRSETSQEVLNQSIEGIEYELANAIHKLTNTERPRIGIVYGHGEIDSLAFASFKNSLMQAYDVFRIHLSDHQQTDHYDAILVTKPKSAFTESEKYKLDQFIMRGGKVLFLLDRLDAEMDSASSNSYFAFPFQHNLEDQLFRYGVRMNYDLVQDRVAAKYPIVTGQVDNQSQLMQIDWPFFPLITQFADHAITRNLDAVILKFASSLDTVKAVGITKTPLFFTSPYSKK